MLGPECQDDSARSEPPDIQALASLIILLVTPGLASALGALLYWKILLRWFRHVSSESLVVAIPVGAGYRDDRT